MGPHETLACIELALYAGILVPTLYCTIRYLLKGNTAWFYLQAFVIGEDSPQFLNNDTWQWLTFHN